MGGSDGASGSSSSSCCSFGGMNQSSQGSSSGGACTRDSTGPGQAPTAARLAHSLPADLQASLPAVQVAASKCGS